jgi:hypothetical protein
MPNYKIIRILISALTIFIFSCGSRNESLNKLDSAKIDLADTTIPFNGKWVSEDYATALIKTKSPRQSEKFVSFFKIPKSFNEKAFSYDYIERGSEGFIIKHGNSYYFKVDNGINDSIKIIFVNRDRIKIDNIIYIKGEENVGVPEDILFKGRYKLNDSYINFNSDGTVVGFDSIKFFSIENIYTQPGSSTENDIIYLGSSKDHTSLYCFEFKSDTLFIYNTYCKELDETGYCLDNQKGKLKWTLTKK